MLTGTHSEKLKKIPTTFLNYYNSLSIFFYCSLQCPFIDVTMEDIDPSQRFNANLVADALRQLILSIHHRAGFINVYQSVMDGSEPDIR